MDIGSVVNFIADNASFSFCDKDGTEWYGSCTEFCCRGNEVHVSGTVRAGPEEWLEQRVDIIHSLSNATLIVS